MKAVVFMFSSPHASRAAPFAHWVEVGVWKAEGYRVLVTHSWLVSAVSACTIRGYGVSQLHLAQDVFQAWIMEAKILLG